MVVRRKQSQLKLSRRRADEQLQAYGGLGGIDVQKVKAYGILDPWPDYNSNLFAESNLCDVPITAVESLPVLGRKPSSIPVYCPRKGRGRPSG
ncbi:aldehyde ferredoxin oxidoreductase [Sesbania bispinosa]|nr:aldehyde ferredoxin oxidoreductase [Sesbania bispinosa]